MIKAGQSFAIPFTTVNSAGRLKDPAVLPTGNMWVGGASSSQGVTITKTTSAQYIASGTFPTDMSEGEIAVIRASYTTDLARFDVVFRGFCYEAVPTGVSPVLSGVPFETRNASNALTAPDALPTAALLVNGVNSGQTVTVTLVDTGKYKATVASMPTLTLGDFVTLRGHWAMAGLAAATDMVRDFYWVPETPSVNPMSWFDGMVTGLTWGQFAATMAVDVTYTSVADVVYTAKAIRRLHERDRVQREYQLNTEKECIWQLDSNVYALPTEEGGVFTHGVDRWVVVGIRERGYLRDFMCRYVETNIYGDKDSVIWSARAPGEWNAVGFNK